MEPSQERREKIQELVSKIRHEEQMQNERKERSTSQKTAKADSADKSCKGKQSTKVGNVLYYIFGFVKLVKQLVTRVQRPIQIVYIS